MDRNAADTPTQRQPDGGAAPESATPPAAPGAGRPEEAAQQARGAQPRTYGAENGAATSDAAAENSTGAAPRPTVETAAGTAAPGNGAQTSAPRHGGNSAAQANTASFTPVAAAAPPVQAPPQPGQPAQNAVAQNDGADGDDTQFIGVIRDTPAPAAPSVRSAIQAEAQAQAHPANPATLTVPVLGASDPIPPAEAAAPARTAAATRAAAPAASASGPGPAAAAASDSAPSAPLAGAAPGPAAAAAAPGAQSAQTAPGTAPVRVLPREAVAGPSPVGVSRGVGCGALILPVAAVLGALACFLDGITSRSEGCSVYGSAMCGSSLGWFGVALPLLISPVGAAVTAIGSIAVRRHRATWLAVGYSIVFVSIIVGFAAASTGGQ